MPRRPSGSTSSTDIVHRSIPLLSRVAARGDRAGVPGGVGGDGAVGSTSRQPTSPSESASATLSCGRITLNAVESASAVAQSGAKTDALAIRSAGRPVRGSTMCETRRPSAGSRADSRRSSRAPRSGFAPTAIGGAFSAGANGIGDAHATGVLAEVLHVAADVEQHVGHALHRARERRGARDDVPLGDRVERDGVAASVGGRCHRCGRRARAARAAREQLASARVVGAAPSRSSVDDRLRGGIERAAGPLAPARRSRASTSASSGETGTSASCVASQRASSLVADHPLRIGSSRSTSASTSDSARRAALVALGRRRCSSSEVPSTCSYAKWKCRARRGRRLQRRIARPSFIVSSRRIIA